MEEIQLRMKELIKILSEAGKAYYQEDREIMSNLQYDRLYDELVDLEQKSGIVLAGSPTRQVGYESVEELPKERHERPMLSLDKTKNMEDLKKFVGNQKVVMSWKLDGLTVVLTYRDGTLFKAVTRGNGEVGEVITNNAKVFDNLPLAIPWKGELILRGEAVISYQDFKRINEEIEDTDAQYKNPRNLCSGSVRQLNNQITAKRHVKFYAFFLVQAQGVEFHNSREEQMKWLANQGFQVVEYRMADQDTVANQVQWFSEQVSKNDIPSDGLVLLYDDIMYGQSLGNTSKFPRDSYAFKWKDEIRNTHLLEIEWSPSRTGLINPVAIFEPVELEGTTVSRASVHNLSIMKSLRLGIGDEIQVYKANMIIPQIADNLTGSGKVSIPSQCPVCGGKTEIKGTQDVETLYCTNEDCQAKKIKLFSLFVSRNALNIDGLSEATLEKFIAKGFIKEFADIFDLEKYEKNIVQMEGFGEKSFRNLIQNIEVAKHTTMPRLLYGLGIPNVGVANAKMLCKAFAYDLEKIRTAGIETLSQIDGIGEVIGRAIADYFKNKKKMEMMDRLVSNLVIEIPEQLENEQNFAGLNFVITGSVEHFANRNEMKSFIEERGGKVTGSVSSKTNYLINNDLTSSSSKNKKAKELGIPILSEQELLQLMHES